ncbi:ATP synthase subunit s, mitochondrial [Leptinotarsa decemlineata]|uniref:ATP synthase subunit s, mitochondrial n=1 Tax=Leptinotarsa decemlineata TaxID=7539 RepID=UPI003D307F2A
MLLKGIFSKPLSLQCQRSLFYWINLQFNALDEQRQKKLGSDRTCAEWILRNGGTIKWVNSSDVLTDYNELPKEGSVRRLQEVDATNTNIMANGFEHFRGCDNLTKLVLNRCYYVEDKALAELHHLKNSLLFLQVSSCPNVTDKGLIGLSVLKNLKDLVLYDLQSVKDLEKVVGALKSDLPRCNVRTEEYK